MEQYRIQRGAFNYDGRQVEGWIIFLATLTPQLTKIVVGQIVDGGDGQAFKELLVRLGAAVEEI